MGCGASKNDVIKSASSGGDGPQEKNNLGDHKNSKDSLNSSVVSEGSTIPASEMYQNGNNNGSGGGGGGPLSNRQGVKTTLPPLKPVRSTKVGFMDDNGGSGERPEPIAFEVPAADEESSSSLIKKHPPRRLRQLEENPPEPPALTHEEIEEKVAQANERRQQVLTQRVASARQKSARAGRIRRPALESEGYSMAEYVNEIEGGESGGGGGGDGVFM